MDPRPPELEGIKEDELAQFVGLALMGILPYAESEVAYMDDDVKNHQPVDDIGPTREELELKAKEAHQAVTRAQKALNMINAHPQWNSRGLPASHFDDTFQIKFDEE